MKYEAIESFSGIISMAKGEIRDIPNDALVKDLMKAKLIKKYTPTDEKILKDELESANSLINELTEENKMLKEQIEELSTINKESEKTNQNSPLQAAIYEIIIFECDWNNFRNS